MNHFRLCPVDGVLEYRLILPGGNLMRWVPFIPEAPFLLADKPYSWRKWLFMQCHEGLLNAHRPCSETYHLLRRLGYWPTLARDVEGWCAECESCIQFRSNRLSTGPMKSILGDECNASTLPRQDVIIDCCGPYTKAEDGCQYILTYTCTQLKVPLLKAFPSLQAGHFSRTLMDCMMRSRVIPDVVRSDRGLR